MKSKTIKLFAFGLSAVMALNSVPALASGSTGSVAGDITANPVIGQDTAQNAESEYSEAITKDSTEATNVFATIGSEFDVTIPKTIILSGDDGIGKYTVDVNGDISASEVVKVVPEESFTMSAVNKNGVTAKVEQDKTSWGWNDMEIDGKGTVTAEGLSAGSWNGTFNFNIKLETGTGSETPVTRASGYYENGEQVYTWEEMIDNKYLIVIDGTLSCGFFEDLQSLTGEIIIDDSVTSIRENAFEDCTDLSSVIIPDSVTEIGRGAFYNCTSLASVTIPNSVTSIGEDTFAECKGLTSVTIPDSVTSIGYGAFYNCTSLASVTIPNSVTSIGTYAFQYCEGLTNVTIGNGVTTIGGWAFQDCTSLASVTIPNSVTSIGTYAFNYCTGLTNVTIGNGVTSIGECAFDFCISLTSVTFNNPDGWYVTQTEGATSGTNLTLTNPSTNATYFKSTYISHYWYKK